MLSDSHPAPRRYHPTARTFLGLADDALITSRLGGHHATAPWNTPRIRELARTIAEDRAFDHLTVLGDALEAAGCDDTAILDHCRDAGEHGDRCWVIDRLGARTT